MTETTKPTTSTPRRPEMHGRLPTIYLAGKVRKNGFRGRPDLGQVMTMFGRAFHYGGPLLYACNHGCAHGDTRHGMGAVGVPTEWEPEHGPSIGCENFLTNEGLGANGLPPAARPYVKRRNLELLRKADEVIAYIEGTDCYGTLFEVGYAEALGKPVTFVLAPEVEIEAVKELWFALEGHPVRERVIIWATEDEAWRAHAALATGGPTR